MAGKRYRQCEDCECCYKSKDEKLHKLTCRSNENALSVESAKKYIQQNKRVRQQVNSIPETSGSVSAQWDNQTRINKTESMPGTEAHDSSENIDYIDSNDSSTLGDISTFFGPPPAIHIPHVERVQTFQDKVSIEFYKLAKDHNLSNAAYDKFIKLFNNYIKDDQFESKPILSRYHAEKRMTDLYPVKPDCYDICSNNCGIFLDSSQEKCAQCGTTRTQQPQTLSYFPLAKQLPCLVSQQSFQSLLVPRSERENKEEPRVLEDIWDGNIYQNKKNDLFKDDLTLWLGLQQDGFVPFNRGGGALPLSMLL
ncbi:hypothetical protein BDC45DRAFT_531554 [Circinella umbellata]|nr:hypothetical protein BDC45DRAFT_531554 [Circinella umbellata]